MLLPVTLDLWMGCPPKLYPEKTVPTRPIQKYNNKFINSIMLRFEGNIRCVFVAYSFSGLRIKDYLAFFLGHLFQLSCHM